MNAGWRTLLLLVATTLWILVQARFTHGRHSLGTQIRLLSETELHQKCTEYLVPLLPKVALMFLALDEMPHEEVWTRWLDGIEGRVPGQVLCREEAVTCLNVLPRGNASEVYTQQHLYTIYVHTKPEFPGYPEGSLFHQRVVPSPIQTAWGDHSIATALRLLLAEALRDPFNQRFQLLCPATVPIRPALFTYTQLIAEERSRIGWYGPSGGVGEHRIPAPLLEEFPEIERHARFHRQFVTLTRLHAQLIDGDERIHDLFHRHCFLAKEQRGHICVSDEQYVGITLSYSLGEDMGKQVTDDLAIAMATTGSGFAPDQLGMELIVQLRGSRANLTLLPGFQDHHSECHAVERLKATIGILNNVWYKDHLCPDFDKRGEQDEPTVVYPYCPYFARKFAAHTAKDVAALLDQLKIAA